MAPTAIRCVVSHGAGRVCHGDDATAGALHFSPFPLSPKHAAHETTGCRITNASQMTGVELRRGQVWSLPLAAGRLYSLDVWKEPARSRVQRGREKGPVACQGRVEGCVCITCVHGIALYLDGS